MIQSNSVDRARAMAREFVEVKMKRIVRSIAMGPDGIYAVVYTAEHQKGTHTMSENKKAAGYR